MMFVPSVRKSMDMLSTSRSTQIPKAISISNLIVCRAARTPSRASTADSSVADRLLRNPSWMLSTVVYSHARRPCRKLTSVSLAGRWII